MALFPLNYWFYGLLIGSIAIQVAPLGMMLFHTETFGTLLAFVVTPLTLWYGRRRQACQWFSLGLLWGLVHTTTWQPAVTSPALGEVIDQELSTLIVKSEDTLFLARGIAKEGDVGELLPRDGFSHDLSAPHSRFRSFTVHPRTPRVTKVSNWLEQHGRHLTADWPTEGRAMARRLVFADRSAPSQHDGQTALTRLGIENYLGQSSLAVLGVALVIRWLVSGPWQLLYGTLLISPRLWAWLGAKLRWVEVLLLCTWGYGITISGGALRGIVLFAVRRLLPVTTGTLRIGPLLTLAAFLQSLAFPLSFASPGIMVGWAITVFAAAELERRSWFGPLKLECFIYLAMYGLFDEGRITSALADIALYPLYLSLFVGTFALGVVGASLVSAPLGHAWQELALITERLGEWADALNRSYLTFAAPWELRLAALILAVTWFISATTFLKVMSYRINR